MFFGRIYQWGKPFKPSWQSYAAYLAIIAFILLAIEFGVLNVLPDNKVGGVLLIVPGFYFVIALVFVLNDALLAAWGYFRRGKKSRKRRKKPAPTP